MIAQLTGAEHKIAPFLIPVSIGLGLVGLAAFLRSLRRDRLEYMKGDVGRIMTAPDQPIRSEAPDGTNGHELAVVNEHRSTRG